MFDFKVLVKVNPDNPEDAARLLGKKVVNDENAFLAVDKVWIAKQDYITAVPVEIALTVEMRAVVQANAPATRFIITGVTAENVKSLREDFEYKVYSPAVEVEEEGPLKPVTLETIPSAGQDTQKYWYNGKEISKEEFDDKMILFQSQWNDVWKSLENPLKRLFSMFNEEK